MSSVSVAVVQLDHAQGLPLPALATAQSAGLDLIAAVSENSPVVIAPLQRALIPTGLCFALPAGYEAQVRPRSGLALKHGLSVLNSPGTIDADYRGEVQVILINLGHESFTVTRGLRIAQLVVAPVTQASLTLVEALPHSERAAGGFGSTGV